MLHSGLMQAVNRKESDRSGSNRRESHRIGQNRTETVVALEVTPTGDQRRWWWGAFSSTIILMLSAFLYLSTLSLTNTMKNYQCHLYFVDKQPFFNINRPIPYSPAASRLFPDGGRVRAGQASPTRAATLFPCSATPGPNRKTNRTQIDT